MHYWLFSGKYGLIPFEMQCNSRLASLLSNVFLGFQTKKVWCALKMSFVMKVIFSLGHFVGKQTVILM